MYTEKEKHLCLREYLDSQGIKFSWFASQIGVAPSYFYHMIIGSKTIPKKYWKKITQVTKGEIVFDEK